MYRERSSPGLIIFSVYALMVASLVAAAFLVVPPARASDEPIDLDENSANGEESLISTKVVNTYPVEIENTVANNSSGGSYLFKWPGAGPGGFDSYVSLGPGVGTIWLWSSVYQVYAIESPITFTAQRSLPSFPGGSDGIEPIGNGNDGIFTVPGRSIFPNDVTLSDASLTASWISFFSPEKTNALCSALCQNGDCTLSLGNLLGEDLNLNVTQPGCCGEPNQTICFGECKSYLTDTANCGGCGNICGPEEICSDGVCMCPGGLTQCGDGCLDLSSDPLNCGGCGNACGIDEFCSGGTCVCPAGQTQCGGGCFDLDNDDDNCGTCGNVCGADQICGSGSCICSDPSRTNCDGTCVNTDSDDANCGACGNACEPDEFCGEGTCQPICTGEICGEECVDPDTDPLNCGGCGNVCGPDEFCSGGSCMCPAGRTQCGAGCLDLGNDDDNCGACGNVCGADQFCSDGVCACSDPGQTVCGGVCVDVQDDPLNCGACGNVCGQNQICSDSACSTCRPPTGTACGNQCVNINTDPFNCGECGQVCDFSGCPSEGQGTCSKGQSCICSDGSTAGGELLSFRPIATDPPGRLKKALSPTEARSRKTETSNVIHETTVRRNATAPEIARALEVEMAPICDVNQFEQMVPAGSTYVQSTGSGRIGKEVQVQVTIEDIHGELLAQGPCPVIVPTTDIDTSGVVLTVSSVLTDDSSGDSLCQSGEAECNYGVVLKNVGDTACINPLVTIASPTDEHNLNELIFLNSVSSYPTIPSYPGDGEVLEGQMNQTPFSITSTDQAGDVGRPFELSVQCQNVQDPLTVPFVLGFGSACTAEDINGENFDELIGLLPPVSAALVPEGYPINFSSGNFKKGPTIPLKLTLKCGGLVLSDAQIDPNPSIEFIEHTILGLRPLDNINGDNNSNPGSPIFSGNDTLFDFQLRTEDLPIGDYIIGIKLPDSRVRLVGLTISP